MTKNNSRRSQRVKSKTKKGNAASSLPKKKVSAASPKKKIKLLAGGNPQIAKGDGHKPVLDYVAALSGWKKNLATQIDQVISKNFPSMQRAVKWNSPFYGTDEGGWIMSFHVFTSYLKITFFNGIALRPIPKGGTERSKNARWLDIRENDTLSEKQLVDWLKQAVALPGWKM